MQKFIIGKNEAGQRFDKFLVKYLPDAPKSLVYKMLRKKNITLNGKKATGNETLSFEDTVESFFSDETFAKFTASSSSIASNKLKDSTPSQNQTANSLISLDDILYEDDNILLVNKKAGILSQKADYKDYSLNEWLTDYLLHTGSITPEQLKTFKPAVCNRLDRNTSGIVICGKSLIGTQVMTELIRNKDIEKHYLTICHGNFTTEGRIEAVISKDNKNNKSTVRLSAQDTNSSESRIITEFTVLKKYTDATLLDVNLLTGKSHQIRAQLSMLGNPIIGDKKYGSTSSFKHQLLHAYKLIFPSQDKMPHEFASLSDRVFEAALPKDFIKCIKQYEL